MPKKLPNLNEQLIAAMREDSNKWDFIVRVIKQEQDGINRNILDKKNDDGQVLNEKQIYDLITWWNFLDWMVSLPERILDETKPQPPQKEPDFETYDLKPLRYKITE